MGEGGRKGGEGRGGQSKEEGKGREGKTGGGSKGGRETLLSGQADVYHVVLVVCG